MKPNSKSARPIIQVSLLVIQTMLDYPSFLPIFASSVIHHTLRASSNYSLIGDAVIAIVLWRLPPNSILSLWRWAIHLSRRWTKIPGIDAIVPEFFIRGGPLGPGCGKVLEVITGCLLWSYAYPTEQLPIHLGPSPSLLTWLVVLGLSGLTTIILALWSSHTKSRGDHTGVHSMVESSRGRVLSNREHLRLMAYAVVNAVCEEIASRGLWMHEFRRRGGVSSNLRANLLQAITFGIWHYHGIPSGWTGVALTFVYGLVMGLMFEYGGGLLLPIVTHSIADYYIFAVIARKGKF